MFVANFIPHTYMLRCLRPMIPIPLYWHTTTLTISIPNRTGRCSTRPCWQDVRSLKRWRCWSYLKPVRSRTSRCRAPAIPRMRACSKWVGSCACIKILHAIHHGDRLATSPHFGTQMARLNELRLRCLSFRGYRRKYLFFFISKLSSYTILIGYLGTCLHIISK